MKINVIVLGFRVAFQTKRLHFSYSVSCPVPDSAEDDRCPDRAGIEHPQTSGSTLDHAVRSTDVVIARYPLASNFSIERQFLGN